MPYGDDQWIKRNPDLFSVMGGDRERLCECGETLVRDGKYWGLQGHPWSPPKVECDCGTMHQIVGLLHPNQTEESEKQEDDGEEKES